MCRMKRGAKGKGHMHHLQTPPLNGGGGVPTNRGNKLGGHFQQVFRGPAFPCLHPYSKNLWGAQWPNPRTGPCTYGHFV